MTLTCSAVIFDLDGVLVDSNPIVERHWETWAERKGVPFEKILAIHHGRPTVEIIQLVAPHLDAETESHEKEITEADDTEGLVVHEGANRLLSALPDDRWAIATSGTRRTATIRLRHVGLPFPNVLVTSNDITNGKPAPDPYLLAAERLGIEPARCVVVEDAPAGIASARAAGMRVIGVTSTNTPQALSDAHGIAPRLADLEIEPTGDLLRIHLNGSTDR